MVEELFGPWKLVSYEAKNAEGKTTYPFGHNPVGLLLYDGSGYMSVQVMKHGRPKFISGDSMEGTHEEVREAFVGFEAYSGTFEINMESETVVHHLLVGRFPNWEDTDQIRHFEIVGNRLSILAPSIHSQGEDWVVQSIWERAD